jgi:hypothetical protein
VRTLAGIEAAVRDPLLAPVSPEIGDFWSKPAAAQQADANEASPASLDG